MAEDLGSPAVRVPRPELGSVDRVFRFNFLVEEEVPLVSAEGLFLQGSLLPSLGR